MIYNNDSYINFSDYFKHSEYNLKMCFIDDALFFGSPKQLEETIEYNRNLENIICDIDGTLVAHNKPSDAAKKSTELVLLEGTIDKLNEWERNGYNIILLTGRKESMRQVTENQLSQVGIYYDQLIMGVGGGPRYLVNDYKPDGTESAFAINVERNKGIKNINI